MSTKVDTHADYIRGKRCLQYKFLKINTGGDALT